MYAVFKSIRSSTLSKSLEAAKAAETAERSGDIATRQREEVMRVDCEPRGKKGGYGEDEGSN